MRTTRDVSILWEDQQGCINLGLECDADRYEEQLISFEKNPTPEKLYTLAPSLRALKWEITSILRDYGRNYKNGGRRFITLAERTQTATRHLPEYIHHSEGDRSPQGAISRFVTEITKAIRDICGEDYANVPSMNKHCLSRSLGA